MIMIMKYHISSALICGAALSLLLAVTPAFSRTIEPDELDFGGSLRLPPTPEGLASPKKKKKPLSMHTVQEDSIIIDPRARLVEWPVPAPGDWGITPGTLDFMDWLEAAVEFDVYRPDLVPFQVNLSLADGAGALIQMQETGSPTFVGLPLGDIVAEAPLSGQTVPAPGALALLALGAGAMLGRRRR